MTIKAWRDSAMQHQDALNGTFKQSEFAVDAFGEAIGKPRLSKTTYASRLAINKGHQYLRLKSTMTPKSFAQQLLLSLYKSFNLGHHVPYETANSTYWMGCMLPPSMIQ